MLHEIFKGMDNASEAINENFEMGAVVESGSSENGHYVRLGNGVQLCFNNVNLIYATDWTLVGDWIYPKPFTSEPFVVSTFSTVTVAASEGASVHTNQKTSSSTKVVAKPSPNGRVYKSSDIQPTDAVAIGFWK